MKERELMQVSEKIDNAAGFDRTCHIVVSRMPWRCAPLMDTRPDSALGGFQLCPANSSNGQITGALTIVRF
jgi:hypothetical protein